MKAEIFVKTSGTRWGVVILKDKEIEEKCGIYNGTQLAAVIFGVTQAFSQLTGATDITVFSDIDYLVQGASHWLPKWIRNDWHKANGDPIANKNEWQDLVAAIGPHNVNWKYDQHSENMHRAFTLAKFAHQ